MSTPALIAFAQTLATRSMDLSFLDITEDGRFQHEGLCVGSVSEYFDENTGGGVWVSHVLHEAPDGTIVHVCSGGDWCSVYRAIGATAEECGDKVWHLHGETEEIVLAETGYDFPPAKQKEILIAMLARWQAAEGLPAESADEQVLRDGLDDRQRRWLHAFTTRWDECGG